MPVVKFVKQRALSQTKLNKLSIRFTEKIPSSDSVRRFESLVIQSNTYNWEISCLDQLHSNFVSSSTNRSIAAEIVDDIADFSFAHDPNWSPFPD